MGANLRAFHFLRNQEFLGMKPVKKITLLQVKELIDQIVEWKWVKPAPMDAHANAPTFFSQFFGPFFFK